MIGLHSTQLKKQYSEILETNALQPVNLIASEVLQPVAIIAPTIDFIKTASFIADTKKDTFITGITMSVNSDSGTALGSCAIEFYPETGPLVQFSISSDLANAASSSVVHIPFPHRGLKIRKGEQFNIAVAQGSCMVQGYIGSDRG